MREPRQQRVSYRARQTAQRLARLRTSQALFEEAEALLEKWKHPDPYIPPTAPGGTNGYDIKKLRNELIIVIGSKYERNIPPPILDRMYRDSSALQNAG